MYIYSKMNNFGYVLNLHASAIIESNYDYFPSDFKHLLEESIEIFLKIYYSEFIRSELIDNNYISNSDNTDVESLISNNSYDDNESDDEDDYYSELINEDIKKMSFEFGKFYAMYVKRYCLTGKLDLIKNQKNRYIMSILLNLDKSENPISTFVSCM